MLIHLQQYKGLSYINVVLLLLLFFCFEKLIILNTKSFKILHLHICIGAFLCHIAVVFPDVCFTIITGTKHFFALPI